MRLLILFAAMVTGALAQAPVIFTNNGPLACGLRLWQPGEVQEYCYHNVPGVPLKTVCNALHVITPSSPGTSLPIAASQSCFATDVTAGFSYEVTWLVWMPVVAIPPGTSGTIQYQIASSKQPCALNDVGTCVGSGTPTTVLQQGTFASGILAANLITTQVEDASAAPVSTETNFGPQWDFAHSSGLLSIVSNDQYAQAITPTGLCVATSATPGIVQFDQDAAGALRVAWLPDGWCTGATSSLTLTGNCTALGLDVVTDGGRCQSVPVEPVVFLAQAALRCF